MCCAGNLNKLIPLKKNLKNLKNLKDLKMSDKRDFFIDPENMKKIKNESKTRAQDGMPLGTEFSSMFLGLRRQVGLGIEAK